MTDMVARVANKIWDDLENLDGCVISIDKAARIARAAIAAMRDPTPEMIQEGVEAEGYSEGDILGIWQSMIDEALK